MTAPVVLTGVVAQVQVFTGYVKVAVPQAVTPVQVQVGLNFLFFQIGEKGLPALICPGALPIPGTGAVVQEGQQGGLGEEQYQDEAGCDGKHQPLLQL